MVAEATKAVEPASKPGRDRSPPFPFIPLRTALDRVAKFDAKFGRYPAPMDKLGLAWEMKALSSQALQTAAALKSYGLVEYTGTTKERAVVLSEDGRTFLRAQQESVKNDIIKRCALKPKALAMCWQRWGADRPPDEVCLDELMLKDKFTDSAARTLLRVYDETVAFAKLRNDGTVALDREPDDDEDSGDLPDAEVGDLVQWEASGVLRFEAPRRMRAKQLFDGQWWAFVDGSETGIPMSELVLVEKGSSEAGKPPTLPLPAATPVSTPTLPGEQELARGKLGQSTTYRLLATGELGAKEIGKLIKLLEAQKAVLADDDE